MVAAVTCSRSVPSWVVSSVESVCTRVQVRQSQILESPRSGRWDIVLELEDGAEVLAWVDRLDQTPSGVAEAIRLALEDAGLSR